MLTRELNNVLWLHSFLIFWPSRPYCLPWSHSQFPSHFPQSPLSLFCPPGCSSYFLSLSFSCHPETSPHCFLGWTFFWFSSLLPFYNLFVGSVKKPFLVIKNRTVFEPPHGEKLYNNQKLLWRHWCFEMNLTYDSIYEHAKTW